MPFRDSIPLSLYIHFPWCVQKCPYCDFNSHTLREPIKEHAYLNALAEDLATFAAFDDPREIQSIFFGGGTPSLITGDLMHEILREVRTNFRLVEHLEITVEANPGTVDASHFAAYREAGVNRLSIGAQSLRDPMLKGLGRIHGSDQIPHAVHTARQAGFENINLDIMFGLPEDDLTGALFDLQTALELEPEHLSWYQLTLEPNTQFYREPPRLPDDDLLWEMQNAGQELLRKAGFEQYEISAYARDEKYCVHNVNYWQFGDYLGIGAGAHSKITQMSGQILRYSRPRHPKQYLESPDRQIEARVLNIEECIFEFMLNSFRLLQGFTLQKFEATTGIQARQIEMTIQHAQARGWLAESQDEQRIKPTATGLQFHNDLISLFLPEAN